MQQFFDDQVGEEVDELAVDGAVEVLALLHDRFAAGLQRAVGRERQLVAEVGAAGDEDDRLLQVVEADQDGLGELEELVDLVYGVASEG